MIQKFLAALTFGLMAGVCAPSAIAADTPPASFDIPKLDHITVDGKPEDWENVGFSVSTFVDESDRVRPRANFDASMKLGWNERGLLMLLRVADDVHVEESFQPNMWQKDSCEIFVATEPGSKAMWQAVVGPGFSPGQTELRSQLFDLRQDGSTKPPLTCEFKRTLTADGYVLEALLPWSNLAIDGKAGGHVAFQIYLNDADGRSRTRSMWFPQLGLPNVRTPMYTLQLSDHASAPSNVAAWGNYEHFRRTRINVVAADELRGKDVIVQQHDNELGRAALSMVDGRCQASLSLPMPAEGSAPSPLIVVVDGRAVQRIVLPDAEEPRKDEFAIAKIQFKPAVFSGSAFGTYDFEGPSHVEDLIGPYTLSAKFYDRDYNEVDHATSPGRYGEVVTVTADSSKVYRKYVTLYHLAQPLDRSGPNRFRAELTIPPEFGIDPAVVHEQGDAVSEKIAGMFDDRRESPSPNAVLLAGLSEMKPGDASEKTLHGIDARDFNWWYGLKKKLDQQPKYGYLDYVPDAIKNAADKSQRWPLIINLHGSGYGGEDPERIREYALCTYLQKENEQRFIVIDPQSLRHDWWHAPLLNDLLDDLLAKYPIDPDRVYLIGTSMGGMGTWDWAITNPERFAAVAPICGRGELIDAMRIKDLPIWAFHGDMDRNVPIGPDLAMFDAMKSLGGRMRLTIFHNDAHYIGYRAFKQPGFLDWLLEQRRGKPAQGPATQPSVVEMK